MPGMIEHYTSIHRELQCFQMRENSVFWTCPTPNQTKMKNPWKSLTFTQKYIICPLCQKNSYYYSPYCLLMVSYWYHLSWQVFSCKEAALEVTFQLVNQSKSVMSCNFRHSDILFVCVCVSVVNIDHSDGHISITY